MDVGGKLTAIVGPNEAGKTSFLRAVEHLGSDAAFAPRELTRDGDGEAYVRAYFKLEDADFEALKGIHQADQIREFTFRRLSDGSNKTQVRPEPTRDLNPRRTVGALFEKVRATKWYERFEPEPATGEEDVGSFTGDAIRSLIDSAIGILAEESETLNAEQLDELELITDRLSPIDELKTLADAVAALVAHLDVERTETPDQIARSVLIDRIPEFLFFNEDSRNLPDEWELGTEPPEGLKNLCELAGLDLAELWIAVQNTDAARRDELVDPANKRLEDFFSRSWGQSKISVHLSVNYPDVGNPTLEVLAWNQEFKYQPLSLRSEGLRQFVALVAFIETRSQRTDVPKILLIDEADQHLHYDAQADLIRVLTTQPVAQKVIYTTHSAGCLPSDLGTGVRLIKQTGPEGIPEDQWGESQVENWFWSSSGTGFSPLLIGMGASNFAFSATRFALMTEGVTDMMLLPTLFCEAADLDYLLFQCVPGLSETTKRTAAHFESTAAKVSYLVDGDDGGKEIREQLVEEGKVDAGSIFELNHDDEKLETEDLIRKEVFVHAVNATISDMRDCPPVVADLVPDVGRVDSVDAWLEQHGEAKLSKRSVAERILDLRNDGPILAPGRVEFVRELLDAIHHSLGIVSQEGEPGDK